MKTNQFLAMAALAAAFAVGSNALAQNATMGSPPPRDGETMFEAMGPGPGGPPDAMEFVGFEGGVAGKTVSGAPFTASFSIQMSQTLADGNTIQRTTNGSIARDSQGRTRREVILPAIGPWAASGKPAPQMTFINDPVAGSRYMLDVSKKVAHKMGVHNHTLNADAKDTHGGAFAAERQKETTTTLLGTQSINGISAEGTRITRTIPAGEIGNKNPIVITVEKWYSPDLQQTVMTKRDDPRMGETVFQMTNVQRSEPAATLFQVPADYTVQQGGHGGPRGMHRGHRFGAGAPPAASSGSPDSASPSSTTTPTP